MTKTIKERDLPNGEIESKFKILPSLALMTVTTFQFGYVIGGAYVLVLIIAIGLILERNLNGITKFALLNYVFLLFDTPDFYIGGSFRFRIWYFTAYLLLIIYLLSFKKIRIVKFSFWVKSLLALYIFFLIYHIGHIFFERDSLAVLYNIKYFLFYINVILILSLIRLNNPLLFFGYISRILNVISIFGLIQFICNLNAVGNFQYFPENLRPAGFYSETNWYGLLCVINLMINYKFKNYFYSKTSYLILQCLSVLGVFLTISRASIFVLILGSLIILFKEINLKIILKGLVLLPIIILTFSWTFSALSGKYNFDINILNRYENSENDGRVEALKKSISLIKSGNLLFGNGFYNSNSDSVAGGAAFGSKSDNIYLMILDVYGLIFFIIFILIVLSLLIYLCYYRYDLISIYLLSVYFIFSLFHPLHLYSLGVFLFSISLMFLKYEKLKSNFSL